MKVESVSPSTEMLRACFEKGYNFSVHYRGGITISVNGDCECGWELIRFRDGKRVSSFELHWEGEKMIEGSDGLVVAMVESMWRDRGLRKDNLIPLEVYTGFLESVLRVYGGKIAHIKSVILNEDTISGC